MDKTPISRRTFLDWVIRGGLLSALAAMVFPALEYLWPVTRQGPAVGMKEVALEEELPVWGAKKVILGGSALLLVRTAQGFRAYSAICTHLGCIVDWDHAKREILCPCHAGLFNLDGNVVSGPPPRPLPSHPVKVVDGKVFVEL